MYLVPQTTNEHFNLYCGTNLSLAAFPLVVSHLFLGRLIFTREVFQGLLLLFLGKYEVQKSHFLISL